MNPARRNWKYSATWAFAALLSGFWCCTAIGQGRDSVKFDVPIQPAAARYVDLLAAPGIGALMLENNGLNPSLSSRLVVEGREGLSIRAGVVRFTGRKGLVFSYEAGFNVSLGDGELSLTFPVEVDATQIADGRLQLRLYPPLARFLPEEILQKVEFKIRSMTNLASQRKLMDYLDRLSKEQQAKGRGLDGVFEAIMLEAYNRSSEGATTHGAPMASYLFDGIILLGVLAIWLIGFPIFLLFARRMRTPSG